MKQALAQGYRYYDLAQNVNEALPKQAKVQNHRKALHYCDVLECAAAIKSSKASEATKLALEFLILTASISVKILNARWNDFSLGVSQNSLFPSWSVLASRIRQSVSIMLLYRIEQ